MHFEPLPKSNVTFELGVLTQRTQVSSWHLVGKFGREGQGKGELRFAKGVAATADGLITIADDTNRRVTAYSHGGQYQFSLVAESRRYGNLMHVPSDVAVSSTGKMRAIYYIYNSLYSQYVRHQWLPQKGDINFPQCMNENQYGESARNTNYMVTNIITDFMLLFSFHVILVYMQKHTMMTINYLQ